MHEVLESTYAGLSRAQQGAPPGHSFSQEHANMYPPEGRPAGHGTSPLSAFQHLVHLKSARKTSCKLSWHRQPHANKACMEGHTGAVGPASGCDALGPRLHSPRQTFRQSLSQHVYYAKAVPYAVSLLHARFYYALPLNPMHFFCSVFFICQSYCWHLKPKPTKSHGSPGQGILKFDVFAKK